MGEDEVNKEMGRALLLADDCKDLDDPSDPYPAEYCGILSRALLDAHASNLRLRDALERAACWVERTQYRVDDARHREFAAELRRALNEVA